MIKLFVLGSIRNILRTKLLTLIKISGLAIGMLCFVITLIFYKHEWSYDKFPDADRIYRYVHRINLPEGMNELAGTSAPTGLVIKERFSEVESVCRILQQSMTLRSKAVEAGFNELKFIYADSTFTRFFPFPLAKTNGLQLLSQPFSVIISPNAAKKYFGSDDPIGKTLIAGEHTEFTVTGVYASTLTTTHLGPVDFVASFQSLEPMSKDPTWASIVPATVNLESKGFNSFYTYFLLAPNASPEEVIKKFPAFIEDFRGKGRSERLKPTLQLMRDIHLRSNLTYEIDQNGNEKTAATFLLVGILILIISSVNFINISTSEFIKRAKGIGIQKVLGTTRLTLIISFLTETLILFAASAALSVVLLHAVLPFFSNVINRQLSIDWYFLASILALVTLLCSLLAGFYPAIYITRVRPAEVVRSRFSLGKSVGLTRNSLVLLQMGVSFTLVSGSLIVYNQLDYLLKKDLGYNSSHLMQINSEGTDPLTLQTFKKEIQRSSNVKNVTSTSTPFGRTGFGFGVQLPESGDEDRKYNVIANYIDPDYLTTLNIPVVAGRFFQEGIPADSVENVVLNETAAKLLFDGDALNKKIQFPSIKGDGAQVVMTVVGIAKDFHHASLHQSIEPHVLLYNPSQFKQVVVRYQEDERVAQIAELLQAKWGTFFPDKAFEYTSIKQNFDLVYSQEKNLLSLITIFSSIAIGIASIGLFGTGLFLVEQKTREFGIRKVLGANNVALQALFGKPLLLLLTISFLISAPTTYYFGEKWLGNFPYRTEISAAIFLLSFLIIASIVLITLAYHFRKMVKLNPVNVLKE